MSWLQKYERVAEARETGTTSLPTCRRAKAVGCAVVTVLIMGGVVLLGMRNTALTRITPGSRPSELVYQFSDCNSLLLHEGCNSIQAWSCEEHPANYGPGLTFKEGYQTEMQCCCNVPKETKPVPKEPDWAFTAPTLFCTMLMRPAPCYEEELVRAQAKAQVGTFGCNDVAVYSSKKIHLAHDWHTDIIEGSLKAPIGGEHHTVLNTVVFIKYWHRVFQDERTWKNQWIVKCDPDTVFLPVRLRQMLRTRWEAGKPKDPEEVYLNNCFLGLHGPIEVMSQQGMKKYKDNEKECTEGIDIENDAPQEDVYFQKCSDKLGIKEVKAYNLLLESAWSCKERPSSPCANNNQCAKSLQNGQGLQMEQVKPPCWSPQVAFHPLKTVGSWFDYWDCAKNLNYNESFYPSGSIPAPANQHHA
mmetsp:Transcript_73393/g.170252  ORF Transcript_73393/g.170252 Transcript_73393/m.170252 type:complete len:415 (-) Transcript_73393:202-1446(-)